MRNDVKDTDKPRAGPVAAPRDGHNISGAAITEAEQEPSIDALSDLWNPSDGTLIESLVGSQGAVTPAAFWPDARQVVTFGSDGSSRIWGTGAVVPQPAPVTPGLLSTVRTLGGASDVVSTSISLQPDPLAPLAAFYNLTRSGVSTHSATIIDTRSGARISTVPASPRVPLAASAPRPGPAGARHTAWMPRSRCSYEPKDMGVASTPYKRRDGRERERGRSRGSRRITPEPSGHLPGASHLAGP